MPPTNNVPPEWQQIVMRAIQEAAERKATTGKTVLQILSEVRAEIQRQMATSGKDPEQVPAYIDSYLATNLTRIVDYALWYADNNPATHRKGYGDAFKQTIKPNPLVFLFEGGASGSWPDGDGDGFPDPAEFPEGGGFSYGLVAPNEIETVRRVMAEHPEIDTSIDIDEVRGRILDYIAHELGTPPWGRKARRADGSSKNGDALTYLREDGLFEIYDVISGGSGGATWKGYGPFGQGQNGYWAPPDPID